MCSVVGNAIPRAEQPLLLAYRVEDSPLTRMCLSGRTVYSGTKFLALRTTQLRNPRALLTYESVKQPAGGGEAEVHLPAGFR